MLRIIFSILLLCQTIILSAGGINQKTKLETVKVFLSGVELSHSAQVELPSKGNYELVFDGIASNIIENSLQVSAGGNVLILSVKSRTNYLTSNVKPQEVIKLEDSLKILNMHKSKTQNDNDVLKMDIEFLVANRQFAGEQKSITVKELQQFADFYSERLKKIKSNILSVEMKLTEIEKDILRITNQLNEINKRRNQPSTEVVVNVAAPKAEKCNFKITYLNNNSGWNPVYDLRAVDIVSPVTLNYKAEVFQNTGIEWKDAKIILSTRNPRESGNKPELYTWYLDFENRYRQNWGQPQQRQLMQKMAPAESLQMDAAALETSIEDFIKISETQMAVEFAAEVNYTIPPDSKRHVIALREYSLPARFEYYAAPKIESDAFLIAYINDWKEMNLLPGKANIYFENSYVGQSVIDPFTTEKELTLSMGRDKNIIIERKMLKDFTEDKFLSSDIERHFAYEIKIKNSKKNNIKLILEEQFPVSKNEDIKVELINNGGAQVDKVKGILKWVIDLNPSEDISKQFIYSVRYPADKVIQGL